ncbi:regulatory protein GemA, partial [Piscinibacter sakaiensis]
MSLDAARQRKAELAQIHIARADLHLQEDEYRQLLLDVTGKTSSAELDAAGRRRLLAHFKACGWAPKHKPFSQAEKIEWFWRRLGQAGALRDPSAQGLIAFIGRTRGMEVSHPRFLPVRDASAVIEALKAWLKRASTTT